MSDVFISYAHEDQPFVRRMVAALEAEGLTVWWDHTIPPGQSWDSFIARGIREAKAAIVVWSRNSIGSDWVKEEASVARAGGKYLPVQIDGSEPPMGFTRIQAANLFDWNGEGDHTQWRMLANEAKRLTLDGAADGGAIVRPPPAPPQPPRPAPAPLLQNQKTGQYAAMALGLLVIIGGAWWFGAHSNGGQRSADSASSAPALSSAAGAPANGQAYSAEPPAQPYQPPPQSYQPPAQPYQPPARPADAYVKPAAPDVTGSWSGTATWTPNGGGDNQAINGVWTLESDGTLHTSGDEHGTWTQNGDSLVLHYIDKRNNWATFTGSVSGGVFTGRLEYPGFGGTFTMHK